MPHNVKRYALLRQYLLVFLVFVLMVSMSSIFAANIVTKYLTTYGEEVIGASAETLEAYLGGYQATFEDIVFVVEDLHSDGGDSVQIQQELERWNSYLHDIDQRYNGFLFIYGVVDHEFIQGAPWDDRAEDYDPATRPWYEGAYDSYGHTHYSDPYVDMKSGEWVMSLSRVLLGEDGTPFGVLAFDILLVTIADYINNMQLMNAGYGVLLDSELRFIVHPDSAVFNIKLDELKLIGSDYVTLAANIRGYEELNAYSYTNYKGVSSVLFSRRLANGWHIYVSSPYSDYYRDVYVMLWVLSLAGLLATIGLCGILTLMHRAKTRSDEATERVKRILDATPFGCKIWGRDLRILDCNEEIVNLFGLKDKSEYIKRYYELLPERQPDGSFSAEAAVKHVKQAFHIGRHVVDEWVYKMPDGALLPSEVTLVRINYAGEIAVAGYIRDLREHNHMMTAIKTQNDIIVSEQRKSEELAHWYKSILDATPLLISVTNADMEWTFVNKAVEEFLNLKSGDILGKPCSNWNSHICNTPDCGIERAKRGLKHTFFKRNGCSYQVDVEILKDMNGKTSGFIEAVQDITAVSESAEKLEQALEEANNASRAKSDFLSNMSHEIRTPLNAILGMTELLGHEQLTEYQRGYVHDIGVSGQSLLSIINDILDMSKIEAGKLELSPVNYSLHELLDNINAMFSYVAKKKHIKFLFEKGQDLPDFLYGDDVRLRQVLTNICGNAVKFTEKGSVRLKVTKVNEQIMFEVKDTGVGIKKEDMSKLFNAFGQANTEKNRGIVGTGLGLVISKSFAEMMGGSIAFDSEYGEGATFIIAIPITEATAEIEAPGMSDKENVTLSAPDAKILVVDDNDFNLKVVSGLLLLSDIKAETVSSGREAIEKIQQNDYDLVFMDHMMPEMDGMEAVSIIRKLKDRTPPGTLKYENLTIVALTANAVFGAREMYLANGFNGFISKPVDLNELNRLLLNMLPPEKIAEDAAGHTAVTGESEPASETFTQKLARIAAVDTALGLSRIAGMENLYEITVKNFYGNLMQECEKMSAFLEEGDIPSFSTVVHAIKSMLSTIGAAEYSLEAEKLETAAKQGDADYCRGHYPPLLKKLQALHEDLKLICG